MIYVLLPDLLFLLEQREVILQSSLWYIAFVKLRFTSLNMHWNLRLHYKFLKRLHYKFLNQYFKPIKLVLVRIRLSTHIKIALAYIPGWSGQISFKWSYHKVRKVDDLVYWSWEAYISLIALFRMQNKYIKYITFWFTLLY